MREITNLQRAILFSLHTPQIIYARIMFDPKIGKQSNTWATRCCVLQPQSRNNDNTLTIKQQ